MSKVESVRKLNARELELGIAGTAGSWHAQYGSSCVVHVGGLNNNMTREKLLGMFEQYGEIYHCEIKEARGYAFVGYADARSAVLAVDNLNGFNVDGRPISVDHVADYTYPLDERGESTKYNVRVFSENTADKDEDENNNNNWISAQESLKQREEIIMARLREMQMQRIKEKRARSDDSIPSNSNKKRARTDRNRNVESDEKKRNVQGEGSGSKRVPGEKEKRRLERAATREERRIRRAKRLVRRAARGETATLTGPT